MKIPYAKSDFAAIRSQGYFYIDKTPYIAHLENLPEDQLVFLRPRRFGKSTLLSTLASYYDIAKTDAFDALFRGLWIHAHPTPKKNAYLVLRLDFSPVASEGTPDEIRASFAVQVKEAIYLFLSRYKALGLAWQRVLRLLQKDENDTAALMTTLLNTIQEHGQQLYLLIDEYDHFGNRLISDGKISTYRELVDASGFVRSFYAALKAFAGTNTIARTLITGVSPIVLDDLSSGFNIITHISQDERFNALVGFTRPEVEHAVDLVLQHEPNLKSDPRFMDRNGLLSVLESYYDGYRFSKYAGERIYNSTLVLYFLGQVLKHSRYPEQMLDLNARTDYGRLYGLAKGATGKEDEVRALLEHILTQGVIHTPIVEQFGTRLPFAAAQAASLFYYMGMLTFGPDAANDIIPALVIPNRVMRELQWEYMGYALADQEHIAVDMTHIERALLTMAQQGDIQPLLGLFTTEVLGRISNRDTIKFNEKIMKLMLMAYLCQTRVFNVISELETQQGYCDLLLGLRSAAMREKYAWIIEAKYVGASAKAATHKKIIGEAFAQLERYLNDQGVVKMLSLGREIKAGVMVFVGTKRIDWYPWPRQEKPLPPSMQPQQAQRHPRADNQQTQSKQRKKQG